MWDDIAPQLSRRLEPVQKVVEIGVEIDATIISLGTTLGPVGGSTLGLRGATSVAAGFATKAAAREAVERLAVSPAAKPLPKKPFPEQRLIAPSRL
ncbi:MAG: hypothetical protein ABR555_18810 [Pyrinomonadaceae bacterium]